MPDSPRWCARCEQYGDHHTDRCPKFAQAASIASRKPDRRLPWLRLLLVVLLSMPAAAFGLWEHDTAHLERLGLCLVWLAFGYAWGWQDRSTTVADRTQGESRG